MKNWRLLGNPINDMTQHLQYTVAENNQTGVLAINTYNMGNAGKAGATYTTFDEFEATGLPDPVKAFLRAQRKLRENQP